MSGGIYLVPLLINGTCAVLSVACGLGELAAALNAFAAGGWFILFGTERR